MNEYKKYLSKTELKNSVIDEVYTDDFQICNGKIGEIEDLLKYSKKGVKIVRFVIINGNIIKLQNYDNGTKVVYVFKKDYIYLGDIINSIKNLANDYNIEVSEFNFD